MHLVEFFPKSSWGAHNLGLTDGSAADDVAAAPNCSGVGGVGTHFDVEAAPSCLDVDGAGTCFGLDVAPSCRDVDGAGAYPDVDAAPSRWVVGCFSV